MTKFLDLTRFPTTLNLREYQEIGGVDVHESLLRSYHICHYAIELLRKGTPGEVVADLMEELQGARGQEEPTT